MKKFLKNNIGELITFITTIIILIVAFKFAGVLDNSIMISDLRSQVYPIIVNFKNMILNNNFRIFNFNYGLGDSLIGIVFYYLCSIFYILVLFIKNIEIFFIIVILLKSSFSSLFCYKYLKYQYDKDNKIIFIIFSLLYGLSSYFVSYNFIVEFLDVYMLFPLLLLGIDKMIKENKYILFIISFTFIIISNYYLAYMICIFIFLYYNYRILINKTNKKDILIKNINFIVISFLICLTLSFVFIPIASELGTYSHNNSKLFGGKDFQFLFNLSDIVNYYIVGNFKDINRNNFFKFYIYSSIIVIPLLYFYFINDKFSKREKILTFILLFVLFISINFNYVNYMWHGFIPPTGFNGRFTFMFILFIIYICSRSLFYVKRFNFKHYIIAFSIIYLTISLYSIYYYPRLISIDIIIIFSIFYFILVLIIYLIRKIIGRGFNIKYFIILFISIISLISIYSIVSNIKLLEIITIFKIILTLLFIIIIYFLPKYKNISIILLLLIILELVINDFNYLYRFEYKSPIGEKYDEVIKYIKDNEKGKFYRIEDDYSGYGINSSILYSYNGIDYFTSTVKKDLVNFFVDLDIQNSYSANCIMFDGSYHLLASLLNVKYYYDNDEGKNIYYSKINNISNNNIYINNEALELGYMVDSNITKMKVSDNGLQYINDIYKNMVNNDKDILDKVDLNKNNNYHYTFNNNSNRNFYILVDLDYFDKGVNGLSDLSIKVYLNDEEFDSKGESLYLFSINNKYDIDSDIDIKITGLDEDLKHIKNIYVYYYNDDIYKEDIDILKTDQLNIIEVTNNGFIGDIDVSKDNILFISCLYNKDLDIYVDGKRVNKLKLLDTFIGVKLDKGKHKIIMKYKPRVLYYSIIPSFIGLILLILYIKRVKKKSL